MADDVTLTIDGVKVTVPKGTLLVEAAKRAQTAEIPVYCYHEKLGPAGLCRVCLVEVVGMPKLQIACYTQATEGMVVNTINDRASEGRRAIMEMFLLNHPLDCPICDKGGECSLQDFSVAYGQSASRMVEAKESKPKAVDLGPTIVLDEERCIVCQRCVRFEQVISHENGLVVKDRGSHDIIATATGEEYRSDFTGNVTELCPVGALTSKTYRFKARPWDNHRTESTCTQCAVGCAQQVDRRHGQITRTMSDQADPVSDGWLCDRGRYSIGYLDSEARIRRPLYRRNGKVSQISWDDAIGLWASALQQSGDRKSIAALGGARLTNEENYLYQSLMRTLGTSNIDWRVGRQQQALVGPAAGTLEDLEHAQAIVTVGLPPSQTAPVFDLRIRKAVTKNNARLISVGIFGARSFVPEQRVANFEEALDHLPHDVQRVALIWDGIDLAQGAALEHFGAELGKRGVTVYRYIAGDAANGRGAEAMGVHPRLTARYAEVARPGLDTAGIWQAAREGRISVLSILGGNPVLQGPDAHTVREALQKIPFVVVSELFETATTELATLILPVASSLERDGHVTNLLGEIRQVRAAIAPPEGVISDGDVLVALADVLEIHLPSAKEVAQIAASAPEKHGGQSFGFADTRLVALTPAASHGQGDLRIAIARDIFAGSGTLAHDARLAHLRRVPSAIVAPATAQKLGLQHDAIVDIVAGNRRLADLKVVVEPTLSAGWLAILDGLSEAPANIFAAGEPIRIENVRGGRQLAGVGA